jgi:hypothetical protein
MTASSPVIRKVGKMPEGVNVDTFGAESQGSEGVESARGCQR